VAELCSGCHSDAKLMAPHRLKTDQTEQWKRGSHGRAVLSGSANAPTCTDCHSAHAGSHSKVSPAAAACGRCHEQHQELFLQSPHARAFRKLGLGDCVPCHGAHEVEKSSWLMGMTPESACSRCHSRDEVPTKVAVQIANLFNGVAKREHEAERSVALAQQGGLFVPDAALSVTSLETTRIKLLTAAHSLDVKQLQQQARAATRAAEESESIVAGALRERQLQRRGYYVALSLTLLLFALLVAKAHQLARRRQRSGA
jgi:predicted CXXCH cytochrome family protein